MRLFRTRTRRRALGGSLAVLVVALVAVGVAVAYYGGSGSGSAEASAGHAPRTVTVTGSPANGALYPGDSVPVDITVTLVGPGSARVGSVESLGISTSNEPDCDPAWFTFDGPTSGFGTGTNVTEATPLVLDGVDAGTLTFLDEPVLQDACSDATITVSLQASPS